MARRTAKQETQPLRYRIWLDSIATYLPFDFDTVEAAVEASERHRSAYHCRRIELNGECVAITLPRYGQ